jgi:hypothetical protein
MVLLIAILGVERERERGQRRKVYMCIGCIEFPVQ